MALLVQKIMRKIKFEVSRIEDTCSFNYMLLSHIQYSCILQSWYCQAYDHVISHRRAQKDSTSLIGRLYLVCNRNNFDKLQKIEEAR